MNYNILALNIFFLMQLLFLVFITAFYFWLVNVDYPKLLQNHKSPLNMFKHKR